MTSQLGVVSLRTEIVDQLHAAILGGVVGPGERLNERILSERFGVSRPPLREAIRQLESEGLVVSIARRGSYVRTFSASDIKELYALRYALEAAAAEFIAESHTTEQLLELDHRLEELGRIVPEGVANTIEADFRFHREIVHAAHLSRLTNAWEQLVRELRLALIFVDASYFEIAFVERTHRPLVDAIKARDRNAIRLCTEDLRKVGDALGDKWEEVTAKIQDPRKGKP